MDYEEFAQRVNAAISIPDRLQTDTLIESENTVHFVITFHKDMNVMTAGRDMERFLDLVYILEERGAVNKQDFVICAYHNTENKSFVVALHTTTEFVSDEDFSKEIKRTGKRPW